MDDNLRIPQRCLYPSFFVTCPHDLRDLWYLKLSVTSFSYPSTMSPILVYVEQGEFSRFFWPSLSKDVSVWTRACLSYQKNKIHRHAHSPVLNIPVPARTFSHVHIDLVGPLPACEGYTYLLTTMDRTTRGPDAVPLASTFCRILRPSIN